MLSKFGELNTSLLNLILHNLEKIQFYTSNYFPGETQQDICLNRRISLYLNDSWTTSSFLTTHPIVIETTLSMMGLCWPWWLLFGIPGLPPDQGLVHLLGLSWAQQPRDKPTLADCKVKYYSEVTPAEKRNTSDSAHITALTNKVPIQPDQKKPHVLFNFMIYWYYLVIISGAEQPWLVEHTWMNPVQWPCSQNKHIARPHRATLAQAGEPSLQSFQEVTKT